jgi:hypothetical protein
MIVSARLESMIILASSNCFDYKNNMNFCGPLICHPSRTRLFGRSLVSSATLSCVILAMALMEPNAHSHVVETVTLRTLGAALKGLMDNVQQAIDKLGNTITSAEIQAGREVNIAISNAESAYKESLGTTVETLDPVIKQKLDSITSLANSFVNKTYTKIDDVMAQAQQIVDSLPFRAHEPQLTKVYPAFVVPTKDSGTIQLNFLGVFEYAARTGFQPTVQVNGKTFQVNVTGTQSLTCGIPLAEMFGNQINKNNTSVSFATIGLFVPWQDTVLFGLKKKDMTNRYSIPLGALPMSPGKIQLIHTWTQPKTVIQHVIRGPWQVSSQKEAGNDDHIDEPYTGTPDTGWHVVQGSSKFTGSGHDYHEDFSDDSGDKVTYKVTTRHQRSGSSGIVDFTIEFDQSKQESETKQQTDSISLGWGDSTSFNLPLGSWKIVFDAFNNTHSEFNGSNHDNPFIEISDDNGGFIVKAKNPGDIKLP